MGAKQEVVVVELELEAQLVQVLKLVQQEPRLEWDLLVLPLL